MLQQLRCLDYKNLKVISFGIRNLSNSEMVFYKNKSRISIFWGKDKMNWNLKTFEKQIKKNVYITFDVDA